MKKIVYFIALMFVGYTSKAQYDEMLDVSDAMQSALDVRTSAVKIVKDYLYRGLKVNYVSKENDENLSNGEFSLLRLEMYAKEHPEIKDQVNKVAHQWKNLRVLALQKPSKNKMKGLLDKLKTFLQASNQLITTIGKDNSIKTLKYQEAATNMELLSQQLAFLYGLEVAGIKDAQIRHEIDQCRRDFQKDLDKTFFSGENTIAISKSLKSIQADWEMAKRVAQTSNVHSLNTIYVLMDKISKAARDSAIQYQEKAKAQLKKK